MLVERLRWRCVLCMWRPSQECSYSTLHFGTVLSTRFLITQDQICVAWLKLGEIFLSRFKCSSFGKTRIKYYNTQSNLFSQLHSPLSPNIKKKILNWDLIYMREGRGKRHEANQKPPKQQWLLHKMPSSIDPERAALMLSPWTPCGGPPSISGHLLDIQRLRPPDL